MRHLLYIPDSKFITIILDEKEVSLENYLNFKNTQEEYKQLSWWDTHSSLTEEAVIYAIINGKFFYTFYERHELDPDNLTREMFEVVDI